MTAAAQHDRKGGYSDGKGHGKWQVKAWKPVEPKNETRGEDKTSGDKGEGKGQKGPMTWSGRLAKDGAPRGIPPRNREDWRPSAPDVGAGHVGSRDAAAPTYTGAPRPPEPPKTVPLPFPLSSQQQPHKDGPSFLSGAKTVQQIEAEMLIAKLSSKGETNTNILDKLGKTPLEAKGSHCDVKKHSDIGCAVVTMESQSAREVVMRLAIQQSEAEARNETQSENSSKERRPEIKIGEVKAQLRSHIDKATKGEFPNDIFVAWGRQAEKVSPLSPAVIASTFDSLFREARKQLAATMQDAVVIPSHSLAKSPKGSPRDATRTAHPQNGVGVSSQPPMPPQPMMQPHVQAQQQAAMFSLMGIQAAAAAAAAARAGQGQLTPQQMQQFQQLQMRLQQQQPGVPPNPQQAAAAAFMMQAAQHAAYMAAQQHQAQAHHQMMMQQQHTQAQTQYYQQPAPAAQPQQQQQQPQQPHQPTPEQLHRQKLQQQVQEQLQQRQQEATLNGLLAAPSTPPRQVSPHGESPAELRADAPSFEATANRGSRSWKIVDPNSGQPIEPDTKNDTAPKKPGHKPLAIIDPNSGSTVDPLGINFTPPKARPLSIIDPSSGALVKASSNPDQV